jgi:hypothetical protein
MVEEVEERMFHLPWNKLSKSKSHSRKKRRRRRNAGIRVREGEDKGTQRHNRHLNARMGSQTHATGQQMYNPSRYPRAACLLGKRNRLRVD